MEAKVKEERLQIVLSTEEKKTFFKLASELNISVGQLVRQCVLDYGGMLDRNEQLGKLVLEQQKLIEKQHGDFIEMVTQDRQNHELVQRICKAFEPALESAPKSIGEKTKEEIASAFNEYFTTTGKRRPGNVKKKPVVDIEIGTS